MCQEAEKQNVEAQLSQKLAAADDEIRKIQKENLELGKSLDAANQEIERLNHVIEEQRVEFDQRLDSACSELASQMQEVFVSTYQLFLFI